MKSGFIVSTLVILGALYAPNLLGSVDLGLLGSVVASLLMFLIMAGLGVFLFSLFATVLEWKAFSLDWLRTLYMGITLLICTLLICTTIIRSVEYLRPPVQAPSQVEVAE